MINALYALILKFFNDMDMGDHISAFITVLSGAILIVAVLSCLFGYKLLRFISAALAFLLTAVGISALLGPTANRAVVVTAFTVLGILAAFLAYQWKEFGAFILCASIGFGFTSLITDILWVHLLSALVLGIVSILLPVTSMISVTSIWGAITLGTDGAEVIGIHPIHYKILLIIGIGLLGIIIQYFTNKEILREELSFIEKWLKRAKTSSDQILEKGGTTQK